jgi:hypothetical protein
MSEIQYTNQAIAQATKERNKDNMEKIDRTAIHAVRANDPNKTVFLFKKEPTPEMIERNKALVTDKAIKPTQLYTEVTKKNENIYKNDPDFTNMVDFIFAFPKKSRSGVAKYLEEKNIIVYKYKQQKYVKTQDFLIMKINRRKLTVI